MENSTKEMEEWKAKFEKEWKDNIETMNEFIKEAEKQKDFSDILTGEIKAWGTSAHIPM